MIGLIALFALAAPAHEDDLDHLQGTWVTNVGPFEDVPVTLTFQGDQYTLEVQTDPTARFTFQGRVVLDTTARPHRLDWVDTIGPDGEAVPKSKAIYKFEDKQIIICSGEPGGERPTAFADGEGRYPSLRTYTRPEPKEAEPEEPLEGDLLALQGAWTADLRDGAATMTLVVDGRDILFSITDPNGQGFKTSGSIEIDESTDPKRMDWKGLAAFGRELPDIPSIYKLEGDELTLRSARPGGGRPVSFEDDARTVLLRRAEPEG